jgi:hypothetical protein
MAVSVKNVELVNENVALRASVDAQLALLTEPSISKSSGPCRRGHWQKLRSARSRENLYLEPKW